MEQKILEYYFRLLKTDEDNAESRTCKRFGISDETLNYILLSDFVDNHP